MKTVAVFFGGKSTEHDVSIVTAIGSIIKPLSLLKTYQVVPVYIAKNGAWYSDDALKDISLFSSGKIEKFLEKNEPVSFMCDGGLTLVKKNVIGSRQKINIDVGFPAMHGTYGEDGSLMGLLRMAGIPFVGCDMEASVVSMNKLLSHLVVASAGVESHRYLGVTKQQFESDKDATVQALTALAFPLFVKPVHLGSSIGVTRVENVEQLVEGLAVAFSYDTVAIVEEAVPNLIEVTVPLVGSADNPEPALVERPLFNAEKIFDFETKYLHGGKGGKKLGAGKTKGSQGYSEVPAVLPGDLYEQSVEIAKRVYTAVGCSGTARIDLLIDAKAKKVYFNEINPLPGSLYEHNWRAAGVSAQQLVGRLVEEAEVRHAQMSAIATNFSTNFLKQF